MAETKQLTIAELVAANAALTAQLAEKDKALLAAQAATSTGREVDAVVKRYGKGTMSIENVNRFPISLHPVQLPKLAKGVTMARVLLSDPKVQNQLRCSAFAYEYAMVATGRNKLKGDAADIPKDSKDKSDARISWEKAWDAGFAIAAANVDIQPESKKYVSPAVVSQAWV